MAVILLARHGETQWNKELRVMGHQHIPLNEKGISQAKDLSTVLSNFEISAAYTSPLKRTTQTTEIALEGREINIIKDDRLIELDFGDWCGKYYKEIIVDRAYKDFYADAINTHIPGGEKFSDIYKRCVDIVTALNNKYDKDETILLVSHCDIIRIILAHYLSIKINDYRKIAIHNASLSIINFSNDIRNLVPLINYVQDINTIKDVFL